MVPEAEVVVSEAATEAAAAADTRAEVTAEVVSEAVAFRHRTDRPVSEARREDNLVVDSDRPDPASAVHPLRSTEHRDLNLAVRAATEAVTLLKEVMAAVETEDMQVIT